MSRRSLNAELGMRNGEWKVSADLRLRLRGERFFERASFLCSLRSLWRFHFGFDFRNQYFV